jgi:anaerobic selenocysteine-containing dehydrogenase
MHNLHSLAKGPDRSKLLMHPRDGERLALAEGDRVRVIGRAGNVRATLALSEDMMPGVVSLPHGFGHADAKDTLHTAGALRGDNVNAVTDERFIEPLVGTSILNGVPVRVERDGA